MQRILITGLFRTASTWQYNAVRLLCEQHAPGMVYACFEDQYDEQEAAEVQYVVVKCHKFSPERVKRFRDFVKLTTFREIGEVRASMERLQARGETGNWCDTDRLDTAIGWAMQWAQRCVHVTYFNTIVRAPQKAVRQLAETLNLHRPGIEKTVAELITELEDPKEGVDETTLLHAKHKTT